MNMVKNKKKKSEIDHQSFVYFLLGGFRVLLLQWKLLGFSFDVKEKGQKLINDFIKIMSLSNN